MTELSDYKRLVEKPAAERAAKGVTELNRRLASAEDKNKELRSALEEVIGMACPTVRSQARLSQGLQSAILRARKILSKSE